MKRGVPTAPPGRWPRGRAAVVVCSAARKAAEPRPFDSGARHGNALCLQRRHIAANCRQRGLGRRRLWWRRARRRRPTAPTVALPRLCPCGALLRALRAPPLLALTHEQQRAQELPEQVAPRHERHVLLEAVVVFKARGRGWERGEKELQRGEERPHVVIRVRARQLKPKRGRPSFL